MFVVIVKAGISSILLRTVDCPLESNRVDYILGEGQQAIDIARLTEGFLKVLLNFPVSIQKNILAVCIAGAHLCFHEARHHRILSIVYTGKIFIRTGENLPQVYSTELKSSPR